MDRTLVSFSFPNLITVPLMAFLGLLLLAVVWQVIGKLTGREQAGGGSTTSGGY